MVSALKTAAAHVTREARRVRVASPIQASALVADIASEGRILRNAAELHGLAGAEAALLAVLHRRIAEARAIGAPGCIGVQAPSVLRATAPQS